MKHANAFLIGAVLFLLNSALLFSQANEPYSFTQNTKPKTTTATVQTKKTDSPDTTVQEQYDTSAAPQQFIYKYKTGDHYRILSTVNEDVFQNMSLDHHATIINRISVQVTDAGADGSATHSTTFMTTEDSVFADSGNVMNWGDEYQSTFTRDAQGVYDIDDCYFMPTIRNVPVFPKKEIAPGDTWTANGDEVQDLRRYFGIEKPYHVPFTATYTYLGTVARTTSDKKEMSYAAASVQKNKQTNVNVDKKIFHVFKVKYSLYFESPVPAPADESYNDWPATWMEFSEQTIYWDAEKGSIDHYREVFRIVLETAYGNLLEYRGDAHAEVTDFVRTNTDDDVAKVKDEVAKMGLDNVTVKQGDKGLTISLDDIKFKADSAVLLESEKTKLDQIAQILEAYPDNDILVTGHTALAGTEKVRQQLSEDRAKTVADYLIELGVRDRFHIFTQGFGATKPVASNTTEAGKAKNRRVEITIMDK